VPPTEQGQIQGGLTSVISLTAVFGPPMMTALFAYFTGDHRPFYLPGAPFLMGGLLTLISVILAVNHFKNKSSKDQAYESNRSN
jgi:DHA1 family tetracycline resistance protein-like MFS transporter